MELSIFCLLPIVFIVNFPSGETLECFDCNSAEKYQGKKCADLLPTSIDYIKNCTQKGIDDGKHYERCRVVTQDVEGDFRIVRSCATWPDMEKQNRCVDRTGTNKIKVRYCECLGEKCNGSSSIFSSVFILQAAVIGLLFANSMSR